ncbi:MAG: gamma-glutamylcyclotransferase [Polyangiaceae bacterium]
MRTPRESEKATRGAQNAPCARRSRASEAQAKNAPLAPSGAMWGPYAERLMRRPEPRATRVFVYGTLLKDEPNHRVLRDARFIARARTAPRFTLLDMGAFPGMIDVGDRPIEGEVYDVTEPILRALDRLESHPHFFRRQWITLGDRSHAQAYLLRSEHRRDFSVIPSGNWRRRNER